MKLKLIMNESSLANIQTVKSVDWQPLSDEIGKIFGMKIKMTLDLNNLKGHYLTSPNVVDKCGLYKIVFKSVEIKCQIFETYNGLFGSAFLLPSNQPDYNSGTQVFLKFKRSDSGYWSFERI